MNPHGLTDVVRSHSFPVMVVSPDGSSRVETVVLTGLDGKGQKLGFTRNGECFIADGGLRWSRYTEGDMEQEPTSLAPKPLEPPDEYFEAQVLGAGGQYDILRVRHVGASDYNPAQKAYLDEQNRLYLQRMDGPGLVRASAHPWSESEDE